ncbi:MAG: GAF domain-containing protein [bacterium]
MPASKNKKELSYNEISNLKLTDNEKLEALISVSNIILSSLNIEEIFQKSVDLLAEHFGYSSAGVFINKPEERKVYSYTYTNLEGNHLALRTLSRAFRSLSVDYSDKENSIVKCIVENKVIESTRLSDFICPAVNLQMSQLIQSVSGTKNVFALPIIRNTKVLGALMVGKKSVENFSTDYTLLVMFSKQLAIAITNAEEYAIKQDANLIQKSIQETKDLYKSYGAIDANEKEKKIDSPSPF